jgi:hypothetical protein
MYKKILAVGVGAVVAVAAFVGFRKRHKEG